MAEVDTSSYPKPQAQPSMLDTMQKFGTLHQQQQQIQSGALTIDKQKLDLVNQRFGEMAKTFTGLANDPDINPQKIISHMRDQLKLGYIDPQMYAKTVSMVPQTQDKKVLKTWLEQQLTHAQTVMEAINSQYGAPQVMDVGNAQQPISVSPIKGIRSTGLPIATQQPPGTPEFDESGQPRFRGVQPPVGAPGMATAPPAVPGAIANPPTPQPRPQGAPSALPVEPPAFNFTQRFDASAPRGGMAGPPPGFAEGMKQRTDDQNIATAKMSAVKPAIQALKILDTNTLATGPGTGQWNDLVALAKAWGVVDTKIENDPTAMRQELEKKLAQYVGNSPIAARSDAAQILAEAGSPNPKKQILPALVNLTRDAIILDRVEAARPNSFSGKMQDYGKHRSTFPQSIDEKAFGLDLMPEEKRVSLVDRMAKQLKSEKAEQRNAAEKFFKSLKIAEQNGFYSQ